MDRISKGRNPSKKCRIQSISRSEWNNVELKMSLSKLISRHTKKGCISTSVVSLAATDNVLRGYWFFGDLGSNRGDLDTRLWRRSNKSSSPGQQHSRLDLVHFSHRGLCSSHFLRRPRPRERNLKVSRLHSPITTDCTEFQDLTAPVRRYPRCFDVCGNLRTLQNGTYRLSTQFLYEGWH